MYNLNKYTYNGEHSWLLEYISKCKKGEIVIGQELMMQLNILLDDLDNPDIRFEMQEPHKRIKFIETKCKHSISPFAGKPFILDIWQKALIEASYGFKVYDEESGQWVKKFTDVLLVIGRKCGKSTLCAALANCEFFCGKAGTNILCASNDFDQSSIVFDEINNMREESKSLERVSRKNLTGIYMGNPRQKRTKGKFSKQNKAKIKKLSARSGAKEGRNIDFAIVDETHEMKDDSLILPIKQSMSTKLEPTMFQITTEGFTNDGYLDQHLKEARQVLCGKLERPRWLIWLYTQDSEQEIWQDKSSWVKSNPGLGKIKRYSFLEGMVEEAKTNMSTRAFVLAKDFNIKQCNSQAWLRPEDYKNESKFNIEDFKGCFGIGGIDLSRTNDLTCSRIMLMRKDDPKKYFWQRYFIPEGKLNELSNADLKMYKEWIDKDLITVSPGNENDFRLVTEWYYDLVREYDIRIFNIGYDRWSATYLIKELQEVDIPTTRVTQNFGTLSNPYKMLEKDFKSKFIVYNDNPIDKFCLQNAAIKINNEQQMMIIKIEGQNDKKIDGAVTMGICYRVYMDNRPIFLDLVNGN